MTMMMTMTMTMTMTMMMMMMMAFVIFIMITCCVSWPVGRFVTLFKVGAFLVADTQLYKRLCPSIGPSFPQSVTTSRKVGKRSFQKLLLYVSLMGEGLGGALGVDGGRLPLPTHPQ